MDSSSKSLHAILGSPAGKTRRVTPLTNDGMKDFIQSIIFKNQLKEPFYVMDLGVVVSLMDKWTRSLPTVRPFYAVKCNPEPSFLASLAALGAGFDCASQAEIQSVLALGVSPDRIVFANPCKPESHIKYAATVGVNLTTFDSTDEVEKIRQHHPKCNLLIRIKPPVDYAAIRELGKKYGALPEEIEPLLRAAKAARLTVSGVSFHVGSGVADSRAYVGAIEAARAVCDTAARLGLPPLRVVDIGGGFTAGSQFDGAADNVKTALEAYFEDEPELIFIAEPGRFFAETAFTLATNVIGKRVRGELREYWINDGIHGSMSIPNNRATVNPTPFASTSNPSNPTCRGARTYCSTVFGPTCDSFDTVLTGQQLPEMQVNDWLIFHDMGAYTAAAGSSFNGFNTSAISTHLAFYQNY